MVMDVARMRRLPVAIAMAGGYGRVIEDTVAVHLQTIRIASQYCRATELA
jgi:acetoin utilization deacetylase AcuC-like enzyme